MKKKVIYILIPFLLIIAILVWFNGGWFKLVFASVGNDSNTVLLLHNNGVDGSKSHAITFNGNAQIDTAQSEFGGSSALFDGTGDYLSTPDSNDWNFGSGDFTIDTWIYVTSFDTNIHNTIFQQYVNANNFFIFKVDPSYIYFTLYISGVPLPNEAHAATINTNTWYHVALTRSGSTWRTFLNGVQAGSVVDATAYPDMAAPAEIGRNTASANTQMTGNLDELRVSKGIARWTADFTPPVRKYVSDSSTALLLHLDGADAATATNDESGGDVSASYHTITYNGDAQIDTAQSYFGGSSALFDGTGDYLSIPDHNDWNFGSGDFTIDFWVRFNSVPARIVFLGQNTDSNTEFFLDNVNLSSKLRMYATNDTGTELVNINMTNNWSPSINTWYHIAWVRSGSTVYLFIDGTSQTLTVNTAIGTLNDYTSTFNIGYDSNNGGYFDNGWLDELRVSKGIARWTENFTPPGKEYGGRKRLIIY